MWAGLLCAVVSTTSARAVYLDVDLVKPNGNVYLGPVAVDGIRVFDRSGHLLKILAPGQVRDAGGGTPSFDRQGNIIVSQINQHNILVMDRLGQIVRTISGGSLQGAMGTAIDPEGNIAVGSYYTDSVKFFSTAGAYLGNLGHYAGTEDPHDLAYDRSGNLFVACRDNGRGKIDGSASQRL